MGEIPDDPDLGTARGGGGRRIGRLVAVAVAMVLVVCVVCAGPSSAAAARTAVIGGSPAPISAYPFMARITARDSMYEYTCTGTVVAPNMILTAAHCLLNESETAYLNPATFQVLTGTGSLAVPGTVSGAERLVVDPGYRASGPFAGWHDAGLIQLSTPVTAPAVSLATTQIWGAGTRAYTVGWGLTGSGELPEEMQGGETVVQSTNYCREEVGPTFHESVQLCSVDTPSYATATCNGDSGGPMLMTTGSGLVEIGITSMGPEGCRTDLPRIDTRVDVESAWVAGEIAAHPSPTATPPSVPPVPKTTTPAPAPTPSPPAAPTPKLPRLTITAARRNAFNVVRTDRRLGPLFRVHSGYNAECQSTSSITASCNVRWFSGPNDYWGSVAIFEEWEGATPVWSYRYSIRSVDDWCYWHSGHRGRCQVSAYRG
ncbi:MAG TPA: serine protease [Solirubrobacterales bacterium]|jgi:V8-like Glu-specific endopeptidase